MLRATWRNRRLKDYDREKIHELDSKNIEEAHEFTKKDIIAMIIAMYQLIMPIVIIIVLVFIAISFLFVKLFLR